MEWRWSSLIVHEFLPLEHLPLEFAVMPKSAIRIHCTQVGIPLYHGTGELSMGIHIYRTWDSIGQSHLSYMVW